MFIQIEERDGAVALRDGGILAFLWDHSDVVMYASGGISLLLAIELKYLQMGKEGLEICLSMPPLPQAWLW